MTPKIPDYKDLMRERYPDVETAEHEVLAGRHIDELYEARRQFTQRDDEATIRP